MRTILNRMKEFPVKQPISSSHRHVHSVNRERLWRSIRTAQLLVPEHGYRADAGQHLPELGQVKEDLKTLLDPQDPLGVTRGTLP
jgi:hypothetical protein